MQASCERLRYHSDRLGASQRIADDAIRRWCVTVSSFAPCSCDSFGADVLSPNLVLCQLQLRQWRRLSGFYIVGKKPPHIITRAPAPLFDASVAAGGGSVYDGTDRITVDDQDCHGYALLSQPISAAPGRVCCLAPSQVAQAWPTARLCTE